MKNISNKFLSIFIVIMLCFSFNIRNVNATDDEDTSLRAVLDTHSTESSQFLRNFRHFDSTMKEPAKGINTKGLKELNMSGSAQFERSNIDVIKKTANKFKVTSVDLREESHGFVNGLPISWKTNRNKANEGLNKEQVLKKEQEQLNSIAINRPFTILPKGGKTTIAKNVESEEQLTKNNSMDYFRVTVTDGRTPTNDTVDYFVTFAKNQPENSYLHFHCKEGIGRTTTFMIMYDIMKNAPEVSFDDIVDRQLALSNLKPTNNESFRNPERMKLLNNFYNYVKDNKADGYKVPFSEYVK